MARRAFEALVRVLVQAGQWILVLSGSGWLLGLEFLLVEALSWGVSSLGVLWLRMVVDADACESGVEKLIVTRVFSERVWVEEGEEPGQRGESFAVGLGLLVVVEGVRVGTQKEGSVVFEDYVETVLDELMVVEGWGMYFLLIDGLSSFGSLVLGVL